MDITYIALMIPFAGIALGAFAVWTDHQRKVLDKQAEMSAEKAAQYAASNQKLEQRVRVLERIVTDKGFDLSMQIEDLRDDTQTKELN
ncbi:hypothetical protein SAMN02745824_2401 [Parasphingorhabdus marina DSM 22363]|uniref:Phage shock protein B n=1 Tax=Parasphingorhabdus marina DSM 22363 TaxID=1123272 RepID=A0A1N6FHY9_9SPHN|nr:hypothetical protein [Parasphingorhabdus marina]SIN94847.1 hypothetical protein SAMN02745824_2401 [Parasphingorhabdus marina DSM 22363]